MGHDVLRLDHHIVARPDDFAFRETDRMPLNDFLDISLGDPRLGGEVATEEEGRVLCRREAGTKREHGAEWKERRELTLRRSVCNLNGRGAASRGRGLVAVARAVKVA